MEYLIYSVYSPYIFRLKLKANMKFLRLDVVGVPWLYTDITLSEEQLKYAEIKVKEAGLQECIRFILCDYCQVPDSIKYDRIISCEMLEAVGHELIESFMSSRDSVLAENCLLVLQSGSFRNLVGLACFCATCFTYS
ncbi:hypothetical protein MKX03_032145 [Papaver bracteatum]|nr:hypothetical protein MKX03_032145 [Papaver bracteatum]